MRREKAREQLPMSISYDNEYNTLEKSPGNKKKKKLNNLLARLTRQTESSERKAKRNQSDDMHGQPAKTYEHSYYKPYSAVKGSRKQMQVFLHYFYRVRIIHTKSDAKTSKPRNQPANDMNIIVKFSKRIHDVNLKRGKLSSKLKKVNFMTYNI